METNIFRTEYRPLSEDEKASVSEIKEAAAKLYDLMEDAIKASPSPAARCIAVAKTNLEQAVMWAVKGITA